MGPHPDLKNLALRTRPGTSAVYENSVEAGKYSVIPNSRRTSTPTRSSGSLESNRGLGHREPDPSHGGNSSSARKGPTLLQRSEDLRAEVHHAMTVNSVTGVPNGFAEPDKIGSRLSGMVVALSEQASELAALRREVEILR